MSIHNKFRVLILISAFGLISNIALSAEKITLGIKNAFAGITAAPTIEALDRNYQFKPSKKVELENGKVKYRLTQYYKNIPVWDAAVVSNNVTVKTSKRMGMMAEENTLAGNFIANIEEDVDSVSPALNEDQAKEVAITAANIANIEQVQNLNTKLYIKNYNNTAKVVYITDFYYSDDKNPRRPYSVIDAVTGEVIEQWEGLTNNLSEASGPGGNAKTGRYYYGKDYKGLTVNYNNGTCALDSPNVATYDLNNKIYDKDEKDSGGELIKFNCPENIGEEVNGGFSAANDAHFFGNVVFNLYQTWYNKAPIDFKLKMNVHSGIDMKNAFFNGKEMFFGDGGKKLYPLTSLDIIAHEISHGFTQQNSNLKYATTQSGAISESFSDIAGEAAEYFFNQNKPEEERVDWMVGETVVKGERGKALRYFENPTRDGYSIDHAKDYKPSRAEQHSTSGVYNKAFYLLAHTKDWNVKKAFDAFVHANQVYWTEETNFNSGACGVKLAAKDLGYNENDIIDAFKEVGVDASCLNNNPDPIVEIEPTPAPTEDQTPAPAPEVTPDPVQTPVGLAIQLEKAKALHNLSANKGESKLFFINVTEKNVNRLNTWSTGDDSQKIRIAFERKPTAADNDCSSKESGLPMKQCKIENPKVGRYYIEISNDKGFDDVTVFAGYL